ncbi:MAG: hypothetical protein WC967_01615 [Balneolaceae bacterium]
MRLFLTATFTLALYVTTSGQVLDNVYSYTENIYSPSTFFVVGEDTILTVELQNKEAVLSLIDLKNDRVISSHPAGRGPGELSTQGSKYISQIGRDSLLVWDEGLYRGMIYDKSLNYISGLKSENNAVAAVVALNNSVAVTKEMFNNKTVAKFQALNETRLTNQTYKQISTTDFQDLEKIESNPLLNQGPLIASGGKVYLGFYFSTKVFVLSPDYTVDTLATPVHLPLPTVPYKNGYAAPDQAKWPKATLSISTDQNYIYMLFSGKKFDDKIFNQISNLLMGKVADSIENANNSNTVHVYDKKTNEYIRTIELPVQAKSIFVFNNHLYALSYKDAMYHIIKYKMNLE